MGDGQYGSIAVPGSGGIRNVFIVDLNSVTANKYEAIEADEVKKTCGHTQPHVEETTVNALPVATGARALKDLELNQYFK